MRLARINKFLILSLITIISAYSSWAEVDLQQKLEPAVKQFTETHPNLNAIFQISQGKAQVIKGSTGYADLQTKKPLNAEGIMPIASGTKQMAAAAILRLQEQGKLDVNDSLAKHLGESHKIWNGQMPQWAQKVTIHQLLTHTSGLPDYIMDIHIKPDMTHAEVNSNIVKFAQDKGLLFEPGSDFLYSSTGYVFVGLILEHVHNKNLINIFKDEFFEPLGLKDTNLVTFDYAMSYQKGEMDDQYPKRYFAVFTGEGKVDFYPAANTSFLPPYADGGVVSSLDNLTLWMAKLHNGEVLSEESYKLMTANHFNIEKYKFPSLNGVGYGIFIGQLSNGETFFTHGGNAIAIRGEYSYIPSKNLIIAIMSNVMVKEYDKTKNNIDFTKNENQVDIFFFHQYLLNLIDKQVQN